MASIELDIIKLRCDKLIPEERRELMDYLAASLDAKHDQPLKDRSGMDFEDLTDDDLKVA